MNEETFEKYSGPRGGITLHPTERWFLYLFLIVAACSWVGITLAELHLFGKALLLGTSCPLGLAGIWITWRSTRRARALPLPPLADHPVIVLGSLLALGMWLFFQPGEFLFNGSDGSAYFNTASMIVKTGGITISDPIVESLSPPLRNQLFPIDRNGQLQRFPGAVQIVKGQRMVVPYFFHLFPVWIATFNLLLGPRGGFYVNAVFGLLSLVALWLLGRRLCSPLAGALGAGLLLLNFGQLWYARFPTSEMLTQFFLLAGLYFTVCCVDGAAPVVGLLAGVAFGLAAFCRIDILVLVSPLILAFLGVVALEQRFSRTWGWYLAGFALLTGHAVGHAVIVARAYTLRIVGEIGLSPQYIIAAVVLSIALGALYAFLLRKRTHWASLKSYLPLLQGAALGLLALRLWPHVESGHLGLLLSPLGVAAAFGGFALLLTRDAALRVLPTVLLFLGSALFYLKSGRDSPLLPWAFRRYVPVILPLGLLFTGHLVGTIWQGRARLRTLILFFPMFLGAAFLANSWPIIKSPPMREAYATVAQFAGHFPPTALLLFDRSVPSHLPLAIDYTFGREALAIYRLENMSTALRELTSHMLSAGHPVYAITTSDARPEENTLQRSDLQGFAVRPAGMFPLRYTTLEWTRDVFPRVVRSVEQRLELYQVLPWQDPAARVPLPLVIDIGGLDFPYLLGGFHWRETWGTATTRWTMGEAQLLLPPLALPAGRGTTLVLRMTGSRPPGMKPPQVTLTLNGAPVANFAAATNDFAIHRFPLPPRVLVKGGEAAPVLTLRTPTFVPKAVGLNEDPRELGVALDWVAVE